MGFRFAMGPNAPRWITSSQELRPDSFLSRPKSKESNMEHHTNRPSSKTDCNRLAYGAARAEEVVTGWPDGPTLRLKDLLKMLCVSKSKAYELMKSDPDFPKGIPLYDSDRSPKFYWAHEAIAWIEGRASRFRSQQEGN